MKGFTEREYKGYGITHLAGTSTFKVVYVFTDGTFDYNHVIVCTNTLKAAKQYIDDLTECEEF